MSLETLTDLVLHIADAYSGRDPLLSIKRLGKLESFSTDRFIGCIHALAIAMERRGISKGDRVAILAENRPEWHAVDFACHMLGAVCVPIYPTITQEQVADILEHSGCRWIFCGSAKVCRAVEESIDLRQLPIQEVVSLDPEEDRRSLAALVAEGSAHRTDQALDSFRSRTTPEDLASLIYTSGTTGRPKGVMLTHRNFISNLLTCRELFEIGPKDLALSFLPLSHVFERTVDYLFFERGVRIHYAPSIERVPPLMLEVQPTVMTSVPRLYERAYIKVMAQIRKDRPLRQRLFAWAVSVGARTARSRELGESIGLALRAQRAVAERLVFRTVKGRFGGRLRFAISGGAPLGDEAERFFDAIGMHLYQGYGLTETSPVLAANSPRGCRFGSVGRPVGNIEMRFAEDGEILVRGPGVMKGYWQDEAATAEAIDGAGWFSTGDVGHVDGDGFVFITDRKKDLLITSGGKNVAPQPIEQRLVEQPVIAQAVVFGDRYPYLTALLVPRFEDLPGHLLQIDPLERIEHPDLLALVAKSVAHVNRKLAEHERIRKWKLLPEELSLEKNEITPTLKVKRRVVRERYRQLIASMYLKTQQVGN